MLSVLRFIGILLALTRVVTVQPALATDVLSDPVATHHLQWSANKQHDFRYRFLKKIKVKTLKYATPATGMFNHHPYLTKFENNLYACWDTQARDENTSGQHSVFCFSSNQGRTWTAPRTLFPPLAPNIPASETIEPGAFQTSQGFCEIDNELFAISIVDIDSKEKFFRFNEVSRTRVGLLARKVFVDGSLGDIFWVSGGLHTRTHDLPTFAKGPKKLIEKIDTHLSQPANLLQLIFGPKIHPDSDDNHRMTEPSPPWQLDDGTWVRLFEMQEVRLQRPVPMLKQRKVDEITSPFPLIMEHTGACRSVQIFQMRARGPTRDDYLTEFSMSSIMFFPCLQKTVGDRCLQSPCLMTGSISIAVQSFVLFHHVLDKKEKRRDMVTHTPIQL